MKNIDNSPLDLMAGIHSTPARRYLSDKKIPEKIIWSILDAAIRGPSGGNTQMWSWIVIRNQDTKNKIAKWYLEGWNKSYGTKREQFVGDIDAKNNLGRKNFLSAEHLANNIQEAPVWILAVLRNTNISNNPRTGSSIYGAVQNLMLAARYYGIGSTLTTLYSGHEKQVKHLLGIPTDAMTMALIPLGYPAKGNWSQPKRTSVEDVTHWEQWNNYKNQ